jgi:hypothetical protein
MIRPLRYVGVGRLHFCRTGVTSPEQAFRMAQPNDIRPRQWSRRAYARQRCNLPERFSVQNGGLWTKDVTLSEVTRRKNPVGWRRADRRVTFDRAVLK